MDGPGPGVVQLQERVIISRAAKFPERYYVSMRLRRRLSVLVAIALVPSLLFTAYNAARWRVFLENETRSTALSEARATSSELDQIIGNARQLLTAMTKFPLNPKTLTFVAPAHT